MRYGLLRRIRKRHDQRHGAVPPAAGLCDGRRSRIERCENRLMLAGTWPALEFDSTYPVEEGGFLMADTARLWRDDAHLLLQGNSDSPFAPPTPPAPVVAPLTEQWYSSHDVLQFDSPDFRHNYSNTL